jgi:pseudouridine synthase, RluA family
MMEKKLEFTVSAEGERLDKAISVYAEQAGEILSRSAAQNLLKNGEVIVNGKKLLKSARLSVGDIVTVSIPAVQELQVLPQDIPLEVYFEDEDLLVVDKPKGMVVHPAPGHSENTLVNALLFHCRDSLSGINGVMRPGIVHRIDKDTSGLLMVAKNNFAHAKLSEQIKDHSFKREYQAVVYGRMKEPQGTVNLPIGRHPQERKKMAVLLGNDSARNAVTHYEVIEEYQGFSHLRIRLETGRTHQIRVHMTHLGHPVAGDPVYGPKKVITSLQGQCLHAMLLGFVHPCTGEYIEIQAESPQYFTKFLSGLSSV